MKGVATGWVPGYPIVSCFMRMGAARLQFTTVQSATRYGSEIPSLQRTQGGGGGTVSRGRIAKQSSVAARPLSQTPPSGCQGEWHDGGSRNCTCQRFSEYFT